MSGTEKKSIPGDMSVAIDEEAQAAFDAFNSAPKVVVQPSQPAKKDKYERLNPLESEKHYYAIFEDNKVQSVRRGSTEEVLVAFTQKEFVKNGYLTHEMMQLQYGFMNGTVTTKAASQIQQDFKNLGAKISVENPEAEKGAEDEVVIGREVYAALRTLREFGGKAAIEEAQNNPALREAIKFRYEQIKDEYSSKKQQIAAVLPTEVNAKDPSKKVLEPVA